MNGKTESLMKAALFAFSLYFQIEFIYESPVVGYQGVVIFFVAGLISCLAFSVRRHVGMRSFLLSGAH
ncbi:MAG: hypothetical protein CL902_00640 [Dehalococcoidia bacterium]|nr:hypothetical protein [Dehalococcoidia bacterium]